MDEGRAAGRTIVAAVPGPELGPPEIRALEDLAPAGAILFSRNLKSPSQARELIVGLREVCPLPILVSVDLEGGRVNRLADLDPALAVLPPARIQARWPVERIERTWRCVGGALRSLGFDVDFAPVVDLDDGAGENAIGSRSFGTDPGKVCACAAAVLRGLAAAGVAGCLKHFPGLGETARNTHQELAVCEASQERLWKHHARPFRRLAEEAPLVMTSHAHYPAVDGTEPLPATFSPRLIGEWLRERGRFDGLVITDDLEMGAVRDEAPAGERARRALTAGADLVLFCGDLDTPRRARDTLAWALAAGDIPEPVLAGSSRRLATLLDRMQDPGGPRPLERFAEAAARLEEQLG